VEVRTVELNIRTLFGSFLTSAFLVNIRMVVVFHPTVKIFTTFSIRTACVVVVFDLDVFVPVGTFDRL